MRRKQTFLEDVSSIEEFKLKLHDDFVNEQLMKSMIYEGNLEVAFSEMNNLDKEKEKRFIEFMHYVDRTLFNYSGKDKDAKRKLRIILSSTIYLGRLYDKIKNYTFRQFLLLCCYSSMFSCEQFEYFESVLDQNILDCIIAKDSSFYIQSDLLEIPFMDIEDYEENKEYIIRHINTSTVKELYDEIFNMICMAFEKGEIVL
jgi:hypothetical protein